MGREMEADMSHVFLGTIEMGFELVSSVEIEEFSTPDLEILNFLGGHETHITCGEMIQRAKAVEVDFGQHHAEQLLMHQDEIPEEWRRKTIFFPGTVWRRGNPCRGYVVVGVGRQARLGTEFISNLYIPYIHWNGVWWVMDFCNLSRKLDRDDCFVRIRK